MELDKETQQQLRRAKKFGALIRSEGWDEAEVELRNNLDALDSISSIDGKLSPEEYKFQCMVNAKIRDILYNWLNGLKTESSFNEKISEPDYIVRREHLGTP